MDKVIVAFEGEKTARRFADILEGGYAAECLICHTADEVKRLVNKRNIHVIVCGYKLHGMTAPDLMEDLPGNTLMVLVALQSQLDLCSNPDIFRVPAPVSKSDLLASVNMVLQMHRRMERQARPKRNDEDKQLIEQAKKLLMERSGMTEEQAHRLIQKRSMDNGTKMTHTARMLISELSDD